MFKTDPKAITAEAGSPFHEGERRVQERLGERNIEAFARKMIRPFMPDQHRSFFEAQPFLIVSARDANGRPWATLLEGREGFVSSPDPTHLEISARTASGDALETALTDGAEMGLLGIELATRRRNRVNGRVARAGDGNIRFAVGQSFGNCPQYIRERDYWFGPEAPQGKVLRADRLTERQVTWINSADTVFIASGYRGTGDHAAFGMDVSHRGGERGFVEVLSNREIRFPDYAGNSHYNTLGNILLDERAGFLFLDFSTGSLLQLTGRARIDWDSADVARFPGARQLVSLEIDEIVELPAALRLRWQEDADSVRSLRLINRVHESADVTSFVFGSRDGGPLPSFTAGQHLPIELPLPDGGKVQRSYSLSGAPEDRQYRISVKREPQGLASRLLHDRLEVGAIVSSRKPAGDFVLPEDTSPLVLVGAGIGITPLMSMLHTLSETGDTRPVWFVHGLRNGALHPFRQEAARLAANKPEIRLHTVYSRPEVVDVETRAFDTQGRITGTLLTRLVDRPDARYLLCGPAGFLAEVKADLERQGVPESRIAFEAF